MVVGESLWRVHSSAFVEHPTHFDFHSPTPKPNKIPDRPFSADLVESWSSPQDLMIVRLIFFYAVDPVKFRSIPPVWRWHSARDNLVSYFKIAVGSIHMVTWIRAWTNSWLGPKLATPVDVHSTQIGRSRVISGAGGCRFGSSPPHRFGEPTHQDPSMARG